MDVDLPVFFFSLSVFIFLFENPGIQEHYKVSSAETHKVLKTVVSLGDSLDLTEGACFLYIFTGVLLAELPVGCALARAYGSGEHHKQGERKTGVLLYQNESNNVQHVSSGIVKI